MKWSSTAGTFNMLQTPSQPKRSRPTSFVSPGLAAAIDRTKVSDRNAAYIIAAAAKSLGHSSSALAINKETIRRSRRNHRERAAKEIRAPLIQVVRQQCTGMEKCCPL